MVCLIIKDHKAVPHVTMYMTYRKVDTNRETDSVAVQCDHNLDFTQPPSTTTLQEEKNGATLG